MTLDLNDADDAHELALRMEELRTARGVRLRDLAGAVGLDMKVLQRMLLGRERFTPSVVDGIARALVAPEGWPHEVPPVLPTDPIPLTAVLKPEYEARNERIRPVVKAAVEEFEDVIAAMRTGDIALAQEAMRRAERLLGPVREELHEDDE